MVNVHMIVWSLTATALAISQTTTVKIVMKGKRCVMNAPVPLNVVRFRATATAHAIRKPLKLGAALSMKQRHALQSKLHLQKKEILPKNQVMMNRNDNALWLPFPSLS